MLLEEEINYLYESRKSYLKQKLYNSEINLDQYAESLESYRSFLLAIKDEMKEQRLTKLDIERW